MYCCKICNEISKSTQNYSILSQAMPERWNTVGFSRPRGQNYEDGIKLVEFGYVQGAADMHGIGIDRSGERDVSLGSL
jgi:hypothetical protein